MNIKILVSCGLVLAAFAAHAVELTEDLVISNRFIQYPGAKPRQRVKLSSKLGLNYGDATSYTLNNARATRVRPVYARNLWDRDNSGEPLFCHRRVMNRGEADAAVEYQAHTWNLNLRRYAFLQMTQSGNDVVVTVSHGDKTTIPSYPPPDNYSVGYDYRFGTLLTTGEAFSDLTLEYWDADEKDPNGSLGYDGDTLSIGYSGPYGIKLVNTIEDDETTEYTTACAIYNERNNDARLVITNALYNKIDIVSAVGNAKFGTGEIKFFHWRDYGSYAEVQAQRENEADSTLRWMFVRFQQDGANVSVKIFGENPSNPTKWTADPTRRFGYDGLRQQRLSYSVNTAPNSNAKGLTSITYYRRRPTRIEDYQTRFPSTLVLSGTNTYAGATVVDGMTLTIDKGADVLPGQDGTTKGVVVVTNGAALILSPNASEDEVAGGAAGLDVRVSTKSQLTLGGVYSIRPSWKLSVDDAVVNVAQTKNDTRLFLGSATLANGAVVAPEHSLVRLGSDTTWVSTGNAEKTNVIAGQVQLHYDDPVTYVTDAPLLLSGGLKSASTGANGGTLIKKGVSVLSYSEVDANDTATTAIKAFDLQNGTFHVCDKFTSPTEIVLGSSVTPATFACAAGTTNSLTKLSLGLKGGSLELGAAACLSVEALGTGFDDYSEPLLVKYADADTSSLVFTEKLTSEQLKHIHLELPDGLKYNVEQTSDGRLVALPNEDAVAVFVQKIYAGFVVKADVRCPTGATRTLKAEILDESGNVVETQTAEVTEVGLSSHAFDFRNLPSPKTYSVRLTTNAGDEQKAVTLKADVVTQITDILLTEDLVLTNRFVQYPDAKKGRFIAIGNVKASTNPPSNGSTTQTIQNAECTRIRPVYSRNLFSTSINGGAAFFYHRRVYNANTPERYVEYQAQAVNKSGSGSRFRCAFVRFAQDGNDVKVSIPVTVDRTDLKDGEIPLLTRTLGYDVPRTGVRNGSDSNLGLAAPLCLVWDEDEKNPGGELEFDDDWLTAGYSGDFGLALRQQPEDLTTEYTQPCRILLDDEIPEYTVITNAIYNRIDLTAATGNGFAGAGPWSFYHWRDYGSYAEVQAQLEDEATSTLKWKFLRLRQCGANVVVSLSGEDAKKWTDNPAYRYGYDGLRHPRSSFVTNGTADGSRTIINSITYYRRRPTRIEDYQYKFYKEGDDFTAHVLSGVNTYKGATVVDGLALALTNRANVLPAGSVLVATNGALLVLQKSTSGQVPSSLDIRVSNRSTLEIEESPYSLAPTWKFLIDDAIMYVPQIATADGALFRTITLANGAVVSPNTASGEFRILTPKDGSATVLSTGDPSKTNIIAGQYRYMGSQSGTITADAPIFFQGGITSGNNGGATCTKNGASELIYSQTNKRDTSTTVALGNLCVEEGAFYVCDKILPPKILTLGSSSTSATFACAPGTTNSITKLALEAKAGTIDLGVGAKLTIDQLGTWTDGDTLLVKYANRHSSSLIFTPTLTTEQLARIRLELPDGQIYAVKQTASGRIVPNIGLILIFR